MKMKAGLDAQKGPNKLYKNRPLGDFHKVSESPGKDGMPSFWLSLLSCAHQKSVQLFNE